MPSDVGRRLCSTMTTTDCRSWMATSNPEQREDGDVGASLRMPVAAPVPCTVDRGADSCSDRVAWPGGARAVARRGITVHTQVVMAPGLNDAMCSRTPSKLAARHQGGLSGYRVVGLTSRPRPPSSRCAATWLDRLWLHQWQARFHHHKTRFASAPMSLSAGWASIPAG